MIIGFLDIWKRVLDSLGIRTWIEQNKFLTDSSVLADSSPNAKPPEFNSAEQVRVLLFRERYGQERRLLFDSKSVKKKDPTANARPKKPVVCNKRTKESSIEKSFKLNNIQERDFVYEWQKSSSDEQMLREMIFGSVSISYQGTTLKVHTIRSPPQIMISIVFPAPPVAVFKVGEPELDESGNWNNSTSEITISKNSEKSEMQLAHSVPVNVPSRLSHHHEENTDSNSDSPQSNDCHSSLPSCHLSPDSRTSSLPRSGSYNSLQRRLLQNKATSIELGLQKQNEELQEEYPRSSRQNRVKLGVSIVISLNEKNKDEERQFQDFLFTHIMLIESHVMHMKNTVIKAYLNRRNFIHLMYEGSMKLQRCIQDLYTAPRLQFPEWLTIISSTNHHHLSYIFMQKLAKLLKAYDKKETNFFVSTLLTAVLTHHLAWVPTVIPTDAKSSLGRSSHKHKPTWVDILAKSRPYNPLWVQLGDLYGAVSSPFKLAKTVITGRKADIILQFLQVLSYFIRCSDICEKIKKKAEVSDDSSSVVSAEAFSDQSTLKSKSNSECGSSTNIAATGVLNSYSPSLNCTDKLIISKSSITEVENKSDLSDITASLKLNSFIMNKAYRNSSLSDTHKFEILNEKTKPNIIITNDCMCMNGVSCMHANGACASSLGYASMEDKTSNCDSSLKCITECENMLPSLFYHTLSHNEDKCGAKNLPNICSSNCEINCCRKKNETNCSSAKHSDYRHTEDIVNTIATTEKTFSTDQQKEKLHNSSDCNSKTKSSETVEEGYHSMEEPLSPCKNNTQLSNMLQVFDSWVPEGLVEVSLPQSQVCAENTSPTVYKSLGWSLMAGISDHYLADFCLQGIQGVVNEDEVRKDLVRTVQGHVLGEPVAEAVCIVADTDRWTVQLLSSNWSEHEKTGFSGNRVAMSSLVSSICEALLNVTELGLPSESCVIYLEDRLQELYFLSQTLSEYLCNHKTSTTFGKVAAALNLDVSDMPLLLSIATTHSPYLSLNR